MRDPLSTTYTGAIEGAEEFGPRIWAKAALHGLECAGHAVMLGDGAPWVWNLADEHFPSAAQIVDLYHAREHLCGLYKFVFTDSDPAIPKRPVALPPGADVPCCD